MSRIKQNRGFTLVEIAIVITIIAISVGGIVAFGGNTWQEFNRISHTAQMRQDAENIRCLVQSDIVRGGSPSLFTDNHGLMVKGGTKTKTYVLKDGVVYLNGSGVERKLTRFPVSDLVWITDKGVITMNITYNYHNIVTKKDNTVRIIKDIDLSTRGGGAR